MNPIIPSIWHKRELYHITTAREGGTTWIVTAETMKTDTWGVGMYRPGSNSLITVFWDDKPAGICYTITRRQ